MSSSVRGCLRGVGVQESRAPRKEEDGGVGGEGYTLHLASQLSPLLGSYEILFCGVERRAEWSSLTTNGFKPWPQSLASSGLHPAQLSLPWGSLA